MQEFPRNLMEQLIPIEDGGLRFKPNATVILDRLIQDRLPKREQIALLMFYREAASYNEVAVALQMSRSNAIQLVLQSLLTLSQLTPYMCVGQPDPFWEELSVQFVTPRHAALEEHGIVCLGDLVWYDKETLLTLPGLSSLDVNHIEEELARRDLYLHPHYPNIAFEDLYLPTRARHIFPKQHINDLPSLLKYSVAELMNIPGMGVGTVTDIRAELASYELYLKGDCLC